MMIGVAWRVVYRTVGSVILACAVMEAAQRRRDKRAEQRHVNACHLVDVARVERRYSEGGWQ